MISAKVYSYKQFSSVHGLLGSLPVTEWQYSGGFVAYCAAFACYGCRFSPLGGLFPNHALRYFIIFGLAIWVLRGMTWFVHILFSQTHSELLIIILNTWHIRTQYEHRPPLIYAAVASIHSIV